MHCFRTFARPIHTVMESKQDLRKRIRQLKKEHTPEQLAQQSEIIMSKLEQHPDFVDANIVMLYSSLPDEVQTQAFIQKWRSQKRIVLPTVVGDDIIPVEVDDNTPFAEGDFHIMEPQNHPYNGSFDLIVVPGMAFDAAGHRLGRGKGYYDRFLCNYPKVKKIGLCFDFQKVSAVPVEATDICMDEVLSL